MRSHFALVLLLAGCSSFAQSRFNGTWQMKMDTLHFSGPPEEYLLDHGMYHCITCVPPVDVSADGVDQKVAGHPYDTIAVRIVDGNSVKFTMKKARKTTFECVETVSEDGQAMTEDFTNTMETETVIGKAGFVRAGKAPAGSHPLSGKWQMLTVQNSTRAGTLTTYQTTDRGMKISDGSQTYEAQFDGKDYAVSADGRSTVSLKLIDDSTIEETDKEDGKVTTTARMTVASDGKSMRVESHEQQRGGTMTYTAVKLP